MEGRDPRRQRDAILTARDGAWPRWLSLTGAQAHLAAFPDLHTKAWNLLKLAGKNKQGVDAQAAADLEAATKELADMFWATKKQATMVGRSG